MPAKKHAPKPHPKSALAAERKFGKQARKAAEIGGKKPIIWQKAENPVKRLPGSVPLEPKRDIFEPPAKTFESDVSRSIEASPSEVFRAFNDPTRRTWCHEPGFAVRGTVAPRSLTLGMRDGSFASVSIARKGNTRCIVSVLQKGLVDAGAADKARGGWREALDRLAGMMAE